jgi:hypothetical protein
MDDALRLRRFRGGSGVAAEISVRVPMPGARPRGAADGAFLGSGREDAASGGLGVVGSRCFERTGGFPSSGRDLPREKKEEVLWMGMREVPGGGEETDGRLGRPLGFASFSSAVPLGLCGLEPWSIREAMAAAGRTSEYDPTWSARRPGAWSTGTVSIWQRRRRAGGGT